MLFFVKPFVLIQEGDTVQDCAMNISGLKGSFYVADVTNYDDCDVLTEEIIQRCPSGWNYVSCSFLLLGKSEKNTGM